MMTIKTMTPLRWIKFGRHVSPGSLVRGMVDGVEKWRGIVLENYPYTTEEFIARECDRGYDRRAMRQLHRGPDLRFQEFETLRESTFLVMPRKPQISVQYLVNGCWLSLKDVLQTRL